MNSPVKFQDTFISMIVIADSGSTKTEWSLVNTETGEQETCLTSGINPLYQDEDSVFQLLRQEFSLPVKELQGIYYYGAGCINEPMKNLVRNSLNRFFHCPSITVQSDLMAAARSLCQDQEGIACILGTGCNSGYYDGRDIVRQVSPLGYILGDEGSGAVMGRKLLADVLKKQLPEAIIRRFFETYALTPEQILESVYKRPFPNRFLAQFARFILNNLSEPAMQDLVKSTFDDFFSRNIRQYPEAGRLPVHFTGGIAWHFRDLLQSSAASFGFQPGAITLKPMEGLIRYHINNPMN